MTSRKISYDSVAFAADQLKRVGRLPTTAAVGEYLGSTDYETIEPLLRKWKAIQASQISKSQPAFTSKQNQESSEA